MKLTDDSNNVLPRSGVLDTLSDDQRRKVQMIATLILVAFDGGDWPLARQLWEEANSNAEHLDADEHVACWDCFDSRQRAYLIREDRKYLEDGSDCIYPK